MGSKHQVLIILALVTFTGCASNPEPPPDRSAASPASQTQTAVTPPGLPAQSLTAGECGLFLWSKAASPSFVFFQRAGEANALAYIDGASRTVEPMRIGGDIFGQFLTEGMFRVQGTADILEMSITPGELIEDGQRISAGRLTRRAADGWETILPVTGVRACMPGRSER